MNVLVSIVPLLGFIVIHLYGARLRFLSGIPRSVWLSGAGGASVAYVFIHLFPELHERQNMMEENLPPELLFLEHHVFLVALTGLSVFYGLERIAVSSRNKEAQDDTPPTHVFWLHIASFSVYNALIGYVLFHREEEGITELVLYFIAIGLHFIINDFGLRETHQQIYRQKGRWVLAAAIAAGWLLGWFKEVSEMAISVVLAFVGGGVILNVLKEELPEQRESRYWAFLVGAAAYTVIVLLAE